MPPELYVGINSHLITLDPLLEQCLETLKFWLDDCINKHDGCPHNIKRQLPSRIIDVSNSSGVQEPYLLADTAAMPPTAYVALSHCWGGIIPVRTSRANLASYQRALPLASLLRTFCDAVTLTRCLDFRYLWIDSLCIIQDDSDDWARELLRMGDIYRYAVLTLSAASATNRADGLLMLRDPDATAIC
jgi:hypothetical protein